MELVAGVVKEFVNESTSSVLQSVVTRMGQEIQLLWGFRTADVDQLQQQLELLADILSAAEQQHGSVRNNRVLYRWLKQAVDVALRAEDAMDKYSYQLLQGKFALEIRSEGGLRFPWFKTKTRLFFSASSNPVVFRIKMAHKVKSLKESIQGLYQEADKLGISPVKVAGGHPYVFNQDSNHRIDAILSVQRELPNLEMVIGRDEDKRKIVRLIDEARSSANHLSVVGVFGPAGLGKTTLCKTIFNEVGDKFEERIWICVSHDFKFNRLLNDMVAKIGDKQRINSPDDHDVIQKLKEQMKDGKFLLVLDDVWPTFGGYWESLRGVLQNVGASTGNTILVTSRTRDTLENMETLRSDPERNAYDVPCTYQLGSLSKEESWCLFKQCVGENILRNSTKEDLGKKILSKCEGVPLAIKVLGVLLRSQNSLSQWKKIEQEGIWNKGGGDSLLILPSVMLSFKYLPFIQLKQCFAYCGAIFEEDEVIEKDRLIQLWMAQGLLQPCYEPYEQLGEKYFRILLNYSLFQEAEFDDTGKVKACKMHDVVHSLAKKISRDNNEIVEDRSLRLQASLPVARFEKLKYCLHVLILDGFFSRKLRDSIGELKHLRYLEISSSVGGTLPVGLGELFHLQTLRIDVDKYFGGLPKFPQEFMKLGNLRHLYCNKPMGIPTGLGMLTSLETLPPLDLSLGDWGGKASELENLRNLRGKLELWGLGGPGHIEQLKKAQLGRKHNIESLVLKFNVLKNDEFDNHMRILEGIEPHHNLVALKVEHYKSKAWPAWAMEMTGYGGSPLNNLEFLTLDYCSDCKQLPRMRNLSALKELTISYCFSATSLEDVSFLVSLQRLEVFCCPSMENLPDVSYLSCLKVLKIEMCRGMICLPAGLSHLPNLETLVVSDLSEDVSMFPFPNVDHSSCLSASLRELYISANRMPKVVNLPEQIQYLRQLRSLRIGCFTSLKEVPEWIGNLTSLETLKLQSLPLIKQLPSQAAMEHFSQLKLLQIRDCPLLRKACETPDGPEQIKIQRIRNVDISW